MTKNGSFLPTILLVDDFPESVDALFATLSDQGFIVALALDGEEGLRQAEAMRPDVVVTDLAMPKMDGLELTRRLKANDATHHIPVILFSAHTGPELVTIAEKTGCAAVIRKPTGTSAVVDLVMRLVSPPHLPWSTAEVPPTTQAEP